MAKKPRVFIIDPTSTTVAQAQEKLKEALRENVPACCPACKQLVALTERPLNPMMAKVAIILHRHFLTAPGWLPVAKHLAETNKLGAGVRGSDWTRLTHWGILEERPKHPGEYTMPEKGHQFARAEIKVPRTIRTYNGKFVGFGPDLVDVKECLGDDLDYSQIIAGNYGAFIA